MKRSSLMMSLVAALALTTPLWSAPSTGEMHKPTAVGDASDPHSSEKAKYDLNHDGKLDDTEKAAMKADKDAAKAKKAADREAKILAKYDANKNGKLDADEESKWKADDEAAKAKRKERAAAKAGEKVKEHAEGEAH